MRSVRVQLSCNMKLLVRIILPACTACTLKRRKTIAHSCPRAQPRMQYGNEPDALLFVRSLFQSPFEAQ